MMSYSEHLGHVEYASLPLLSYGIVPLPKQILQ